MSIIINKILSNDLVLHSYNCELIHCGNILNLNVVSNSPDSIIVGNNLQFEMNYDSIDAIEIIDDFEDNNSGISQDQNGKIVILGRVHNILVSNDIKIIDIYLMNGPEFISIDDKDISGVDIQVRLGVRLFVNTLVVYPYS